MEVSWQVWLNVLPAGGVDVSNGNEVPKNRTKSASCIRHGWADQVQVIYPVDEHEPRQVHCQDKHDISCRKF